MKKSKFPLTNIVLYAKGWYKRTDNVFDDLKKILKLDGYTPFTNSDVMSIIVNNFDKFDIPASSLIQVLEGIHPNQCCKTGFYTNEHKWVKNYEKLPNYNYELAVIYYVLSTLRFLDNTQWDVKVPKVTKYPMGNEITIRRIYETFIKKHQQSNR